MQLKKATRKKVRLKLQVGASSGAGKTFGSLLLAKGLVGDWSKIAVIDTENDSASLYVNKNGIGEFNTITLTDYSEKGYIKALELCEEAGIECVIIDTSTRLWDYILELQTKLGGRYQDWAEPKAKYKKYVYKMLSSDMHIISTVRKKEEYVMEQEEGSKKTVIKKLGLKEQQDGNLTYEFTIVFDIDQASHLTTCSKDRTGLFDGIDPFMLNESVGIKIKEWCDEGVESHKENTLQEELLIIENLNQIKDLNEFNNYWKSLDSDIKSNDNIREVAIKIKNQLIK